MNESFSQVENNPVDKSSSLVENNPLAQNQPKKDIKSKLDQFYSKGPASYGSIKRLQTRSKLPVGKVPSYLETKPSFTKYRSIQLKFPSLKVFVKDINEIWSLDLGHVDKLAKYNRNIKYLLVAVDYLS